MKTRKAVSKRFKLSATGKVKFKRQGLRHILTGKSASTKMGRRKAGYLENKGDANHVYVNLPYGSLK